MTQPETKRKMRAFEHALAQQWLEGLSVSPETTETLSRAVDGETSTAAIIQELYKRYAHVDVQEP